ncbi:MAG: 4Fe-4S dicluster domain-containing protein, partial [Clostridiales bacterium]|nr:4Fe-4S dicluster domain-containing protein [Clostridiales bacterium]
MSYKIVGRCVCCHYCASECPAQAIGFVGSQYAINPDKCTGCGICAEVCPISVIENEEVPRKKPEAHPLKHMSCDLLVLGGGGAGLIAAVKAAEVSGGKVIVLEKAKKTGGST